jgi:phage protein D
MAPQISYALTIDGTTAAASVLNAVRQIDVEDHAQMADMLRLRLATAVRDDGRGWTILDDGLFPRLANLRLSLTIGSGKAIPVISAYVVETTAQFSNDPNASLVTVVAMDPTALMHLDEKVKSWPNMKDSDVASAVFSDRAYRFTPVVDDTKWSRQENDQTLVQRGTDIQFLQQLAERNGFECFVELNPSSGAVEGHFHAPKHDTQPQGVLTVNMGEATNVSRFRTRFDMLGPTTAQATTLDIEDGSNQSGEADSASQGGLGRESSTETDRPRRVLLSQLAMAQSGEAQRYAQAVVDRSSWSIVAEGELSTVAYGGLLRAKRPVMVRGVGRQFSGRYYVERVLLTISSDSSCVQRFTLRRNALGLTGRESFQSDDALAS